jgi:hypothetical protein
MTHNSSDQGRFNEENEGSGGVIDSGASEEQGGTKGPGPKGPGGIPFSPTDAGESNEGPDDDMCQRGMSDPPAGGGVHGPGGLP